MTLTIGRGAEQASVEAQPGDRVDQLLATAFENLELDGNDLIIVDGLEAEPDDTVSATTRQIEVIEPVGELG